MQTKIKVFFSLVTWCAVGVCFAQLEESPAFPSNGSSIISPELKLSSDKLSAQDRFDEVLSVSRSFCGQRYPYPVVSNKNPFEEKDIQLCRRLELTGKRIECEINFMGAQNAKGKAFGSESLPALKEWASCTGKVSVLLEEGYYVPSAEINRRLQFCIYQFYKHPGEAPKLGWMDRMTKSLLRPDYRASAPVALDPNFFDKSSIRIDDQKGGLLKCQYMMPQEIPGQAIKAEGTKLVAPTVVVHEEKSPPIPSTKSQPKKHTSEVAKPPSPVVKNLDVKVLPPVGECRRPKQDCPK